MRAPRPEGGGSDEAAVPSRDDEAQVLAEEHEQCRRGAGKNAKFHFFKCPCQLEDSARTVAPIVGRVGVKGENEGNHELSITTRHQDPEHFRNQVTWIRNMF